MIVFAPASSTDIAALVESWNSSVPPEYPLSERLLRQVTETDPYYEPEGNIVARDGDKIIGWVLCKANRKAGAEIGRFQNRGGIGALCVHPDYQCRGIGSQLLQRAEAHLREAGSLCTLLYFPHHIAPGVPVECEAARAFFTKQGYHSWRETVDLSRGLHDYEIPSKVQAALQKNPTVEIRPAREGEKDALIEFVAREFPGSWDYSTRSHFERGGPANEFIVVVETAGAAPEVIGFCRIADFTSQYLIPSTHWFPALGEKWGGLGPIGVAAAHRKRGLGLALCAISVNDLKQRGVQCMAIDWTNLVDFYGQLGFTVWRRYLQAER